MCLEYKKLVSFNDGLLHLYFFNVGQGDSFLIKTPSQKLIFIDGGADETVAFRLSRVLPFWIHKIDYVFLSHFHRDHYMGIYYLANRFEIGEILYGRSNEVPGELTFLFDGDLPGGKNGKKGLMVKDYLLTLNENGTFIDVFNLAGSQSLINENYGSLIVQVRYGDFEAVFTGDAPPSIQKAAQNYLSTNIDVLKVPHQGSKYDLNQSFVEFLNPEISVISVGKNPYGHPHQEVLDYYSNRPNSQLFRTDMIKNYLLIKSDGEGYSVFSQ